MAERYSERERGYIEASSRAREAISAARSAKGASVLMRRYLLDEPWCEVAADVGCSSRTAMRLHDEALLDVYESMPHAMLFAVAVAKCYGGGKWIKDIA